jgi:hypothetical protein
MSAPPTAPPTRPSPVAIPATMTSPSLPCINDSLTLSTLLCSVQSAGIVLGVIALFIGLISSMMICGVVRLECDSLRVLVS